MSLLRMVYRTCVPLFPICLMDVKSEIIFLRGKFGGSLGGGGVEIWGTLFP